MARPVADCVEIGTQMTTSSSHKYSSLALILATAIASLNPSCIEAQTASPSPTTPAQGDPFVNAQPSGPDMPPPDLWDIATGEHIPAADVLKTKDFGARVKGFDRYSPPWGTFQPGDIVLAVNNFRTYGGHEYALARNRDPLSSTLSFLINRNGDLLWVKLHNLLPGHRIGLQTDRKEEEDRFPAAIESLGLPAPDDDMLPALHLLPTHAAAALYLWASPNPSAAAANTAWLKDFIDLYLAVESRHYSEAIAPAHQPPIPYFQRLEKFYISVAAANQPKEIEPDVTKTGESPEFYVLAMPIPWCVPPLGDLHFTDLRFNSLVNRVYAARSGLDAETKAAAEDYAHSKADDLDRYLDNTKASILDRERLGGIIYDSNLVNQPISIKVLIQALAGQMKDESRPDWPLDACGMIALKFRNGDFQEAADLVDALGKHSPWLAASATRNAHYHGWLVPGGNDHFDALFKVLDRTNNFFGPEIPAVYRWALDTVAPIAVADQEYPPWVAREEPYYLLTDSPYAELSALKAARPAPAAFAPSPTPDAPSGQSNGKH